MDNKVGITKWLFHLNKFWENVEEKNIYDI